MNSWFERLRRGLIVSCQAMENEPFHGPELMARMALAAKMAGAHGIRANGSRDIRAIRKIVDLPIIGLYKKTYPGYEPFITPTFTEAREVAEAGADMIAIDATDRTHPREQVPELIRRIHMELNLPVLADISTTAEARAAAAAGADMVATTLRGYTTQTKGMVVDPDFLREVVRAVPCPVLAEGRIQTPRQARQAIDAGAFAVVVGSAITRPQEITKRFLVEITRGTGSDEP
ncbi:MAG: N-acetylmannosamine-6-phosphate 2-epimerase [Alicyclobacillus sp.]|nr:N-acetylmannosamine-6-phosphate 2-epimerase [Alicyclobacillus sp.]